MPLFSDGRDLILHQLYRLAHGESVGIVEIGHLTDAQFNNLCEMKLELEHPVPGSPILVYKGKHHFESRVLKDGYCIEDLAIQIECALSVDSVVIIEKHMTALVSQLTRLDGYGNTVRDRAILELQQRKPKGEVYSVIPKGDRGGPKGNRAHKALL